MKQLEEIILGAALIDSTCIEALNEIITTPEFFTSEKNQIIWSAISQLNSKGLGIDLVTVTEQIRRSGKLDIATPYDITILSTNVVQASHAEHHALILKEAYIRRQTENQCLLTLKDCADVTKDSLDIVSELQANIQKISIASDLKHERSIGDIVLEVVNAKETDTGIPSHKLLESPKHFRNGDLVIIAGRPSMGKTAFALSIAEQAALSGYPVGVLSLEMTSRGLVSRMISGRTAIPFDRIESNNILPAEMEVYIKQSGIIGQLPIYIDDQCGITDQQAKSKSARMKARHGIELLIVDYLQLLSSNDKKAGSREQEVSTISRTLKNIAKTLDIPVIALSQLSRAVESRSDKKPMLSDLRDSGAIEQDADLVLFMYRPEYYGLTETPTHRNTEGLCQVITAKYRNGGLLSNDMKFIGQRFSFEKWDGGGNVKITF